jgi:hypothetical protein
MVIPDPHAGCPPSGIMSGPGVLAEKVFDRLEEKYAAMGMSSHD